MTNQERSRVMTIDDLADYLRVHRSTCYRLIKYKHLPSFKVGSDYRFNLEQVEAWIAERSVNPHEPHAGG